MAPADHDFGQPVAGLMAVVVHADVAPINSLVARDAAEMGEMGKK